MKLDPSVSSKVRTTRDSITPTQRKAVDPKGQEAGRVPGARAPVWLHVWLHV